MKSVIRFTFAKCSNLSPSKNAEKWKFCYKGFVNQLCLVASRLKITINYFSGIRNKNTINEGLKQTLESSSDQKITIL